MGKIPQACCFAAEVLAHVLYMSPDPPGISVFRVLELETSPYYEGVKHKVNWTPSIKLYQDN